MNTNPTPNPGYAYEQAEIELLVAVAGPEVARAALRGTLDDVEYDRLWDNYDDCKKEAVEKLMGLKPGSTFRWGDKGYLWRVIDPAGWSPNTVLRRVDREEADWEFDDNQEIGLYRDWKRGSVAPVRVSYEDVR
jgi:hypothetical protein